MQNTVSPSSGGGSTGGVGVIVTTLERLGAGAVGFAVSESVWADRYTCGKQSKQFEIWYFLEISPQQDFISRLCLVRQQFEGG